MFYSLFLASTSRATILTGSAVSSDDGVPKGAQLYDRWHEWDEAPCGDTQDAVHLQKFAVARPKIKTSRNRLMWITKSQARGQMLC